LTRIGSAWALISWSRPLLSGYCTTCTAVIFRPETVSRTWTGPYRVSAALPVTVLVAADDAALDGVLGDAALDDGALDGAVADEAPVPDPADDEPAEGLPVVPVLPVAVPPIGASAAALPPAAAAFDEVDVW
jgi:hypothetical protein